MITLTGIEITLAHEARIASLEHKLSDALARIAKLEKAAVKKKPKRVMDRAEHEAHARMAEISQPVAIRYGVRLEWMRSHDRRSAFTWPRFEAWKLCHDAGYSTPMIGRFFGGRDHSTILAGIRRAEEKASPPRVVQGLQVSGG